MVSAGEARNLSPTSRSCGAQVVGRGAAPQLEWHLEQTLAWRWEPIGAMILTVGGSNSATSSTTGAYRSFTSGIAFHIGL